jgi:Flp pilus assembly protein TadG
MIKRTLARIRQFARDGRGSVSVEAVLVLPFLLSGYVATFVFFDAFRVQNTNLKSSYTLADMISRQTQLVTPEYIEGMNLIYDYLNNTGETSWVRVTNVRWDTTDKEFKVIWSYGTRNHGKLNDKTVNYFADQLPAMAPWDSEIIVETFLDYTPSFNVGITPRTFTQFIVTRPRLGPQVKFGSS